jgi:DNA segregation ATPase FtsK/SpoIIIE, S-DNA-T family
MPQKRQKSSGKSGSRNTASNKGHIFLYIFIVIIVALACFALWWYLPNIINWTEKTWSNLVDALGIGILILLGYLCILIWSFVTKKLSIYFKYGLKWLGAIFLTFFIWGICSFISIKLGGKFGQGIISDSAVIGILRLAGLLLLGSLCFFPSRTWKIIIAFFKLLYLGIKSGLIRLAQSIRKAMQSGKAARANQEQSVKVEKAVKQEQSSPQPKIEKPEILQQSKEPIEYKPALTVGGWQLPPVNILDKPVDVEVTQSDVEKRAKLIEESLTSYGVDAKIIQMNVGPTVTQFGVEPGWDKKFKEVKEKDKDGNVKIKQIEISRTRVKVERISSLSNDLALALAAPSIRIEAPVPGKSIVGIEVPNTTFGSVNLRSVIESPSYQKILSKSKLAIALGKGAGGETVAADLTKMPHLLIAGSTGSGKTVYINSIICCSLINNTPDEVRFIMIDPKRVELVNFNNVPHLISPVVVDSDKAVVALRWLTQEMDERYRKFAVAKVRNIEAFNKNRQPGETMPFILLFIDELADLMMTSFDEVEHNLCRLAQLARATGIHLVVATQRPSVDVITGLIKANFPTRISFSLTSQVDSRTILDSTGAEKLLGRGDMLYMPTDASKPLRLQGPFLTDQEIDRLVQFWVKQKRPDMIPVKFEDVDSESKTGGVGEDPLMDVARQLASEHGTISTSFLQRRLNIGYPRAARIMDKLREESGKGDIDKPLTPQG